MLKSEKPWRSAGGAIYRPCDAVLNFALARKQIVDSCPWDEDLPLNEHCEFFYRLRRQAQWRVAYCPSVGVLHHRDRPSDYRPHRERKFTQHVRAKTGLNFTLPGSQFVEIEATRPNIVVLGVGHANTSITTRQLHALGWQAGDADEEYGESVSVREINQRFLKKTRQFDHQSAAAALDRLPEPWAIKDPRFAETLSEWAPALVPYQPLLVWITKDRGLVVESYVRRGTSRSTAERRVAQREAACEERFADWPWGRMTIETAVLAAAVSLFDMTR